MNNDSGQAFSQATDSLHAVVANTATAGQVAGLTMDQVLLVTLLLVQLALHLFQAALLAYTSGRVNANIGAIESGVDFTSTMKGNLAATSDIATAVITASLVSI